MIQATNSNLINRTLTSKGQNKPKAPVITKPEPEKKGVKLNPNTVDMLVDCGITGIIVGSLFFLPEILQRKASRKKDTSVINSLLGNVFTSIKRTPSKNGMQRFVLEADGQDFLNREVMLLSSDNKIKQRIFTKFEKKTGGKKVLREMKSYKGKDLSDISDIANNEQKYIAKEFIRKKINKSEYVVSVGNGVVVDKRYKTVMTPFGQPIMKIEENANQKKSSAYLYNNMNRCVGLDKEVLNKENGVSEHFLTMPEKKLFSIAYDPAKEEKYDSKLLNLLIKYF